MGAAKSNGKAEIVAKLLDPLYAAATDPTRWPTFLDGLAASLGAIVPGLFVHRRDTGEELLRVEVGQDPAWGKRFRDYYVRLDVRRPRIQALPEGAVYRGQDVIPDREFTRTEFYQDFLRPQDFFHIAGGVVFKDERHIGVVRTLRPRGTEPFSARELGLFRLLLPHLRRALQVHRELARADAERDGFRDVLDDLPTGVLLLDRRGRLVTMNARAAAITGAADGLFVGRAGILGTTPEQESLFAQAVTNALREAGTPVRGSALALGRPSGRRPLQLLVSPLRAGWLLDLADRAAVVVFVTDPEARVEVPAEAVRRHLGLTKAEAELAVLLATGRSVEEAARDLGRAPETARTQMKRVLARTKVHRQADLVRLVLTSPATFGKPPGSV